MLFNVKKKRDQKRECENEGDQRDQGSIREHPKNLPQTDGPERWWLQTISGWTSAAKATNIGPQDRCGDDCCNLLRQDWCGEGDKPWAAAAPERWWLQTSAAGLVRRGLQTSADLLRMYKFNQKWSLNQKIVVYKEKANRALQTWAAGPERWLLQ